MSTCEDEIVEIANDRDAWRNLAEQHREQIAELERRLERQQVHHSILSTEALQKYDAALERFQMERDLARTERDDARYDVQRIVGAINKVKDFVYDSVSDRKAKMQSWLDELNKLAQTTEVTHLFAALYTSAAEVAEEDHAFAEAQLANVADLSDEELEDAYRAPGVSLLLIFMLARGDAQLDIAEQLMQIAHKVAHPPYEVAEMILAETRAFGLPRSKTLHWLPIQWIKDNLPNPPNSYRKLSEGLHWAQEYLNSGKPALTFADLHQDAISDKTLRKYIGWYNKLEEIRKVTDFLPTSDVPTALKSGA